MPAYTLFLENKHYQPQATIEIEDGAIPRTGEIIYAPEHGYGGMDWYLVEDVRYTIKGSRSYPEVSAHAISSDYAKGHKEARFEFRNREGWLDFELDPEEEN